MAIYPLSAYYSTTLSPRVTSYELLADRILRQLGAPLINLEIACSTVFDHIAQAIEWYTKYAGHTEEFLVFDSALYIPGLGVKLDDLFTRTRETYVPEQYIHTTVTTTVSTSATSGISVSATTYSTDVRTTSATTFSATSATDTTTVSSVSAITDTIVYTTTALSAVSGIFDLDLNLYRKVKTVQSFNEGTSTGINTLFTIEQSLAQQTYFAYSMGNYGFDLITWEIMKQWLELRERVLAQKVYIRFDPRTQYMRLLPEPMLDRRYFGLIQATVERPIKDLVRERWVMQYALALTKISIANVRGKFGQVALFGGGSLNATDIMTQGLAEKDKLEDELMNQVGEADPLPFFIG